MNDKVYIWSDGACAGNPGPGGYATVVKHGGNSKVIVGSSAHTTNNRMELRGFISGLRLVTRQMPCTKSVTVYTDSKYIANAINFKWLNRWQLTGYKGIKNPELWADIAELLNELTVEVIWVKGHADNTYNLVADRFAVLARDQSIPDGTMIEL